MKHPMQSADIDEKLSAITANVDWQSLSQAEAADFGVAVGAYRDARAVYDLKRTAWGTSTGTVLSLTVLSIVALLVNASPLLIIAIMLLSQGLRCAKLWWDAQTAKKDVLTTEDEACEYADELAEKRAFAAR